MWQSKKKIEGVVEVTVFQELQCLPSVLRIVLTPTECQQAIIESLCAHAEAVDSCTKVLIQTFLGHGGRIDLDGDFGFVIEDEAVICEKSNC